MKTGFVTFEDYHGKKDIGSSRIRAKWIIKYWNKFGPDMGDAELFKFGGKYDVVIFQKAYWVQFAKEFKGVKILDLCDPDWRHWIYNVKEMIEEIDAITCSSMEICKFVVGLTDKPVVYIPDRIDFEILPGRKSHKGPTKKVAWFGYSDNFPMVDASIPALRKRGLELIVVSNKVYIPNGSMGDIPLSNLPWSESTYLKDIMKADIVINPQIKKGKWLYKSNNKTTMAWSLGLPVAHTDKELDELMTEEDRIKESYDRLKEVEDNYNVEKSVIELKELINEIKK